VGLFVRSDTNVEDLDNFNGAGLNLTLFNRRSLQDVYAGLKEVWASPFTYRSFSWRQTLIDEPLWVLPSVVILESVPTKKSGVLITADLDGQDQTKMLVATSEGVGGAVDGTPAETVVWSPSGVELVTMFKSPYRRLLKPGGSEIVASTGSEYVLSEAELNDLVTTAARIRDTFASSPGSDGRARPWDVEFGFVDGKLWLFQARPFIGNESLANVSALAAYEAPQAGGSERVSLDEVLR
jgi:phosphoenolpyruvate synthase/pyruvate phosphate dikinase